MGRTVPSVIKDLEEWTDLDPDVSVPEKDLRRHLEVRDCKIGTPEHRVFRVPRKLCRSSF